MSDILDQSEVDALLEAVEGGGIEAMAAPAAAAGGGEAVPESAPFDFKRPERVSKDQMRSIETLHEVFARNLGVSLSGYTRTIVEVKVVSVEQLTYAEFIMSLPNPTYFNLISCSPLEGDVVLEMNPSILYPILDRLLGGGRSKPIIPSRAFTEIELAVARNILDRALVQLRTVWENVKPIEFLTRQTESNPLLMQIVPPTEPVVLSSFEVSTGEYIGLLNLCIPFKVIEPIVKEFSSYTWFGFARGRKEAANFRDAIQANVARAQLDLTVELARTRLTMDQVLSLKVGDVIKTGKGRSEPLLVLVEGQPLFCAAAGRHRRNLAAEVTSPAARELLEPR